MSSYQVSDLKEGSYFTEEAYLDKTFILLCNTTPISASLLNRLEEWQFHEIESAGNISAAAATAPASASVDEAMQEVDFAHDSPSAQELPEVAGNDSTRMQAVRSFYNECLAYTNSVLTTYATHKTINHVDIHERIKAWCIFLKEHKRYVLRIKSNPSSAPNDRMLSHALRTTMISLAVGLQLRMPLANLINLGVASLLHEIGLLRIPPQISFTNRTLSINEQKTLISHPLISYKILKENLFNTPICLAALEHHERENGGGYPRKVTGERLSEFGKIIALACAYDTMTAPYETKSPLTAHDAVRDLIKNAKVSYDERVVQAFLFALSIYPIGSFVVLSDKRIAEVFDVNPADAKTPVVHIPGTKDSEGNPLVVNTSADGIAITRALNREETAVFEKKLKSIAAAS